MIKDKREKTEKLLQNPYQYYVTNWGFVGNNQPKPTDRRVNPKR